MHTSVRLATLMLGLLSIVGCQGVADSSAGSALPLAPQSMPRPAAPPTALIASSILTGTTKGNVMVGSVGSISSFSKAATISVAGVPGFVAFDAKHNLFVTSTQGGLTSISAYAPPYTKPYAVLSTKNNVYGVYGIALGANGSLYVYEQGTQAGRSQVAIFAAPLRSTSQPLSVIAQTQGSTGGLASTGPSIVLDATGDIFLASGCSPSCAVGEHDAVIELLAGTYTAVSITKGISYPNSLAIASNGTLFVGNCQACLTGKGSSITTYAPPYRSAPTRTITRNVSYPLGFVLDAAGDLFSADSKLGVVEYPANASAGKPILGQLGFGSQSLGITAAGTLLVPNASSRIISASNAPYSNGSTLIGNVTPSQIGIAP